jgi:hypothetical protein
MAGEDRPATGVGLRTRRCCAVARAAIPVIILGEFRYGNAGSRHRSTYEAWLEASRRWPMA